MGVSGVSLLCVFTTTPRAVPSLGGWDRGLTDLSLGFRRCQSLQFTMLVVRVLSIYTYV